jgi:hypothetical protein
MPGKGSHRVAHGSWSPRQIIGLVLAVCLLMVVIPIGARAAGQLVTLVDSVTSNQARVAGGQLSVSDIPVGGKRFVAQAFTGNVAALVTLYDASSTTKKNAMIGSVTFVNGSTSSAIARLEFLSPCSGGGENVDLLVDQSIPAKKTVHYTFPEPLPVLRSDTNWCLAAFASVGGFETEIVGYNY